MPDLRRVVLFAVLAVSACDKPSDLPRMQDEVLTATRELRARFDDLKRRAEAIEPRTRALPPDTSTAAAQHALGQARAAIDQSLGYLQQVPTMLPAWTKSTDTRELLKTWLDGKRPQLEAAVTEATSELGAVESWTAVAEQRAGTPPPPSTPAAEPADDREPAADSSGAPIR